MGVETAQWYAWRSSYTSAIFSFELVPSLAWRRACIPTAPASYISASVPGAVWSRVHNVSYGALAFSFNPSMCHALGAERAHESQAVLS